MNLFCAELEDNFNWLLQRKSDLKDIVREAKGEKAVPKTPKRGVSAFARIQETIAMFEGLVAKVEESSPLPEGRSTTPRALTGQMPCSKRVLEFVDDTVNYESKESEQEKSALLNENNDACVLVENIAASSTQGVPNENKIFSADIQDAKNVAGQNTIENFTENISELEPSVTIPVNQNNDSEPDGNHEPHNNAHNNAVQIENIQHKEVEVKTERLNMNSNVPTRKSARVKKSVVKTPVMTREIKEEILSDQRTQKRFDLNSHPSSHDNFSINDIPEVRVREESNGCLVKNQNPIEIEDKQRLYTHNKALPCKNLSVKTDTRPVSATANIVQIKPGCPGVPYTGISHPELETIRIPHEHIVNTPVKPERREQVQRIISIQDQARERLASPKRPVRTTKTGTSSALSRDHIVKPPRAAEVKKITKEDVAQKLLLQKQKHELAMQNKEEQTKEKADRVRKDREEKQKRAQRKREMQEAEERAKAENARIMQEKKDQMLKLMRSPGRSKPGIASPARLRNLTTEKDRTVAKQLALPGTPGRVPSKAAKLIQLSGEAIREATYNSPARSTRRKQSRALKIEQFSGDESMDIEIAEERIKQRNIVEKKERPMNEREKQRRLNEEERICFAKIEEEKRKLDEEKRLQDERVEAEKKRKKIEEERVHQKKKEGEERNRQRREEEERIIQRKEEEERIRQRREEEKRMRQRREEEEIIQQKKEEDRIRQRREEEDRIRQRKEEEDRIRQRKEEEDRIRQRKEDEEKIRQKREEEERIRQKREEEERIRQKKEEEDERIRKKNEKEEAMTRLNISSNKELHNRHLENVSMNMSQRSANNSSYEMTPEKVHKPASTENYNIDDLSSGDETDQEEAPRKQVPAWAEGNKLRRAIKAQMHLQRKGALDSFFAEIIPPDLQMIFGTSKKYPRRGSSAHWESPISKPRHGVSAYQEHRLK